MKRLLVFIKKLFGQSPSDSGFTLIELLVVIAILAVLAVGTLIAVNPAARINSAKDTTSQNSMSTVINALETYYTDNQYYPGSATVSTDLTTGSKYLRTMPSDAAGNSFSGTYASLTGSGGSACTTAAKTCGAYSIWFVTTADSTKTTCYKSSTGATTTVTSPGSTNCTP